MCACIDIHFELNAVEIEIAVSLGVHSICFTLLPYHSFILSFTVGVQMENYRSSATIRFGLCLSALLMILLVEFHAAGRLSARNRLWKHCFSISLESSLCHLKECLFNLGSICGTRLKEHHVVVLSRPSLSCLSAHLPVSLQI